MKKLSIKYEGKKLTYPEINAFEDSIGFTFPAFFSRFLVEYNGAAVIENTYKNKYSFTTFLPLESKRNASISTIIDGYKSDLNSENWLPFAIDSGGWVFVISIDKNTYGQVYIDKFDSGEENTMEFVASSFEEFINALQADEMV